LTKHLPLSSHSPPFSSHLRSPYSILVPRVKFFSLSSLLISFALGASPIPFLRFLLLLEPLQPDRTPFPSPPRFLRLGYAPNFRVTLSFFFLHFRVEWLGNSSPPPFPSLLLSRVLSDRDFDYLESLFFLPSPRSFPFPAYLPPLRFLCEAFAPFRRIFHLPSTSLPGDLPQLYSSSFLVFFCVSCVSFCPAGLRRGPSLRQAVEAVLCQSSTRFRFRGLIPILPSANPPMTLVFEKNFLPPPPPVDPPSFPHSPFERSRFFPTSPSAVYSCPQLSFSQDDFILGFSSFPFRRCLLLSLDSVTLLICFSLSGQYPCLTHPTDLLFSSL